MGFPSEQDNDREIDSRVRDAVRELLRDADARCMRLAMSRAKPMTIGIDVQRSKVEAKLDAIADALCALVIEK